MKIPKVGKRNIKTFIAVFISLLVYVVLLLIDKARGVGHLDDNAISNMYTPFFAGIAAAYATHRDKKSSLNQGKIRSFGSLIGGYFGMLIILLSEYILIDILNLMETNYPLHIFITFLIVSLGIIPLIVLTVMLKQNSAVFITCLTYLSVTISNRNGGMPVFLFATNRVLSTLVGIGISLFVNNFSFFKSKNKDILFVSSLDNNFLTNGNMSDYVKYKLNNLYFKDMPLTFATTRTLTTLGMIFEDIELSSPIVVMNGGAIYDFNKKTYEDVYCIDKETKKLIDKKLNENNINAFVYSINDNMLHAYYQKIENEGELNYYKTGRNSNFDNFVKAILPSDLEASLYIIIDKKEKIEKVKTELTNLTDKIDLITYPYTEIEGDYYYLKINSVKAKKENLVKKIYKEGNYKKLVVCGRGKTDLELIKISDFSVALDTSPEYIKNEVDYIVSGEVENVLKIFEEIYYSKNIDKTINKIIKRK